MDIVFHRAISLPNMPERIDMTRMSEQDFHAEIQKGIDDYKAGRVHDADTAFKEFLEKHK